MIDYDQDGIIVRRSVRRDVDRFKTRLRESDVQEIWASHRHTPESALTDCVTKAMVSYSVFVVGEPAAIFGINPRNILSREAVIWMLSTDALLSIGTRFVRHSRRYVRQMQEYYPYLYNYVDARNSVSINWLRWCGAGIKDPQPYGPDGLPFHYFYFKR